MVALDHRQPPAKLENFRIVRVDLRELSDQRRRGARLVAEDEQARQNDLGADMLGIDLKRPLQMFPDSPRVPERAEGAGKK